MKRETYYHGAAGQKYGIWNNSRKCFQFGICEDTPMLAESRLFQKIGDNARKWRFEARPLPRQKSEKLRDSMTESHSEAAILRGCIALMQNLMGRFEEYLDFIDFHPDNEEELFCTEFYMTEIVERLFLWETRHSGGTSQHMKLTALGVEAETVVFKDDREEQENAD